MIDPELNELLDEVSEGVVSTGQRAEMLYAKLLDAQQAHRPWASSMLRDVALTGCAAVVKRHMKARSLVKVKRSPQPTSTIIGVPTVVAGRIVWHQKSMADATWAELGDYLDMLRANQRAVNRNVRAIKSLLALQSKAPGTKTVGEAADELATSIEEVLAA